MARKLITSVVELHKHCKVVGFSLEVTDFELCDVDIACLLNDHSIDNYPVLKQHLENCAGDKFNKITLRRLVNTLAARIICDVTIESIA